MAFSEQCQIDGVGCDGGIYDDDEENYSTDECRCGCHSERGADLWTNRDVVAYHLPPDQYREAADFEREDPSAVTDYLGRVWVLFTQFRTRG